MNVFDIAAITLGGTTLSGIVDQSYTAGAEEMLLGSTGASNPSFLAVSAVKPTFSFTTLDVKAGLDVGGLLATAYSSAVDIYFRQRNFGGAYGDGTAASSIKVSLSKSLLVPKTISANHNAEATISFDLYACSTDGSTSPVTITTAAAPYTPEKKNPDVWTVGSAEFGAVVASVQSISVDTGAQVEQHGHSGTPYDQYIGVHEYRPKVSVECMNISNLSTITSVGALSADMSVFFRKMTLGGTRVATGTATHISLTSTGGMVFNRGTSGSHLSPATLSLEYIPVWDGSTSPIVVSTTSAIS